MKVTTIMMDELVQAGLIDETQAHHLTVKGRDWLRQLGDLETQEVVDVQEAAADLILSTNGLFR